MQSAERKAKTADAADPAVLPVAATAPAPGLAADSALCTLTSALSPETVIDLGLALRLAGATNPTIALAQEQVNEALAGQLAARALLLPSVNVGGNVRVHRGVLMSGPGLVFPVSSQSLYLGAGTGAVGSGTLAFPGARLFAHLGDAAFEPLAAAQRVAASRSEAGAVQNDILRDVATAYLDLVGAEATLAVLREGEAELAEVVRLAGVYAEKGQGRAGDANRALANADLLRRDVRRGEEEIAVASARLCRLLSLDPATRLRTPGGPVEVVRLVPENQDLPTLVALAGQARPEVSARAAELAQAQTRVRQERVRPWLPTVSVGYSRGAFGGGSDRVASNFGSLAGRSDFDVAAFWTVENLGVGNRARVRRAGAEVGQAVAEYNVTLNRVSREVAEAFTESEAAAVQLTLAEAATRLADEGFALERERIRQGEGRPLEVLDSFRQRLDSRRERVRAAVAFDAAQFRLLAAVGQPAG